MAGAVVSGNKGQGEAMSCFGCPWFRVAFDPDDDGCRKAPWGKCPDEDEEKEEFQEDEGAEE